MTTGISNQNRQTATSTNLNFSGVNEQTLAANAKLIDSTLKLMNEAVNLAGKALDTADQMGKAVQAQQQFGTGGCFPTEQPNPADSFHREASLRVDDSGKITTPGGYTIEQLGQFEWKITGPDNKETRVWGDPHVEESDGGKWDFKKNTEFVLGDGTRIDVTCKPYGNGATVTGQLDIVNGDSHVRVTDIDKGKGKVGPVTDDGHAQLSTFNIAGADHVTMGKTTADWTFEGREIVGSENQGEKLKTKNEVATITSNWMTQFATKKKGNDTLQAMQERFDSVQKLFESLTNTRAMGFNPFRRQNDFAKYDRNQHLEGMKASFNAMTEMMKALQRQFEISGMLRGRGSNIA
ncbi:DUF1521 domain-containing protein [Archangium minus]|uniref:DUF1521 domain-containing protein n=1 Tax=Archangium minus TaxID=83450 RepID=A0ABY9WPF1_9BACT|nr:DUF1521 domain-containing protein [Archangium violaceum]WNG45670.1 DUF1521 domain-containing protein [Archangium minus]